MILFDLTCADGHVFEAWFHDGEAYDAQAAAGEISCPVCGDTAVAKALMTPNVARRASGVDPERAAALMHRLRAIHDHVKKNSDDVGARFPEEARKIHYGEAEKRNIRGHANLKDARALDAEGVEFGILPPLPRQDS